MNGIVIAVIVGVIVGIGSTVLTMSVMGNTSNISLSDEEKKEIQIYINNKCPNGHHECTSQVYTSFWMKKQLGL